jgi:hypothetical protein
MTGCVTGTDTDEEEPPDEVLFLPHPANSNKAAVIALIIRVFIKRNAA